ncbi:MAG TPA: tetratricopeptide repeat protein [Caulobacteraceae bacterium]|nr:tetratricopeptide repeat protein [Caulobacteraceae bacterium]
MAPKSEQTIGWKTQAERLRAAVAASAGSPAGAALQAALKALAAGNLALAAERAREAVRADSSCAVGWRLLALGLEGQGEMIAALEAYQAAHEADPAAADLLSDLSRLAASLGSFDVAAEFAARALAAEPGSAPLAGQLAMALRGAHRYGEAIEVLRAAITADAGDAFLWNALGSVLLQQGDTDNALIFLDQALTLEPGRVEALCNRARARLELGDGTGALADCAAALARASAGQRSEALFIRALARLDSGDLAGGWADYEARLSPDLARTPSFSLPGRRWAAGDGLDGKALLVVGEQGLGDEIMFAGVIPDVTEALGAGGTLSLAVAPRLVELFHRSFPSARVSAHETATVAGRPLRTAPGAGVDADFWAPMGSLPRRFRPDLASFERAAGYLRPDPGKAEAWRRALAAIDGRPKIGLSWKSMKTSGDRLKQYPAFDAWERLLATPGVSFVNLQYGDCGAELARARDLGVEIWNPPGLDLTNDIDGAAALSSAVDLVIGVGNASTNLAGAVGVPVWISAAPFAWPRLGAENYPWFPKTRVFAAARFGDWGPVVDAIAQALGARFG